MEHDADPRCAALHERAPARYRERTSGSAAMSAAAVQARLFRGVPMPWMAEWQMPHPLHAASAEGVPHRRRRTSFAPAGRVLHS